MNWRSRKAQEEVKREGEVILQSARWGRRVRFSVAGAALLVLGCGTEHIPSQGPFVYDLPPNIAFSFSTNAPGQSASHQVRFDITMGELETFQAVLTYPSEFTFNGFTALGPANTEIASYGVDFDFDGTIDFTVPVLAIDQNNAYGDRFLDGVFTPGVDATIEHTGAHIFTITLPFGGDGDPGTIVGPFAERTTATILAGILSNPVTPGCYTLGGSFTSVDPDSGGADDNQNNSPINFTTTQIENIRDAQTVEPSVGANGPAFIPGDTLTVSVGMNNLGFACTVDFYFGALLPDGDTVVFFTDLAFTTGVGSLANPNTLQPIVAGVDLTAPFVFTEPAFFTFPWAGTEPAGSYVLFLAVVVSGALADNSIDAGDIVAVATIPVTFTP